MIKYLFGVLQGIRYGCLVWKGDFSKEGKSTFLQTMPALSVQYRHSFSRAKGHILLICTLFSMQDRGTTYLFTHINIVIVAKTKLRTNLCAYLSYYKRNLTFALSKVQMISFKRRVR